MCRQAQLQAEWGNCDCEDTSDDNDNDNDDDDFIPLSEQYIDMNGACNMCDGQSHNFIPESKQEDTINTGIIGTMNCGGL